MFKKCNLGNIIDFVMELLLKDLPLKASHIIFHNIHVNTTKCGKCEINRFENERKRKQDQKAVCFSVSTYVFFND